MLMCLRACVYAEAPSKKPAAAAVVSSSISGLVCTSSLSHPVLLNVALYMPHAASSSWNEELECELAEAGQGREGEGGEGEGKEANVREWQ